MRMAQVVKYWVPLWSALAAWTYCKELYGPCTLWVFGSLVGIAIMVLGDIYGRH